MRRAETDNRAFLRHEFIGTRIRVAESAHPPYMGMEGRVVDETMHTFRVRTDSDIRMIPKAGNTFLLDGKKVNGRQIMFRPEDRIKKIR